ncbi:MAG: hypothetical protein AMJ81_09755, partial [Phycisphaerae bacterium SM23_33]
MLQAAATGRDRNAAQPPAELEGFRRSMRRFAEHYSALPVKTQATCPVCRRVVPAVFERCGRQVVLTYHCGGCGRPREVHADAIWSEVASDFPGSRRRTLTGGPIQPVLRRLPRTVQTLCPECCAVIVGRTFVEGGAVYMEKSCPEHGHFRDCVSPDALLYSKAAWWTFQEHPG